MHNCNNRTANFIYGRSPPRTKRFMLPCIRVCVSRIAFLFLCASVLRCAYAFSLHFIAISVWRLLFAGAQIYLLLAGLVYYRARQSVVAVGRAHVSLPTNQLHSAGMIASVCARTFLLILLHADQLFSFRLLFIEYIFSFAMCSMCVLSLIEPHSFCRVSTS